MTTTPELDLIDELIAQTPVLGTDAGDVLHMSTAEVQARGASSGEVTIHAAARSLHAIRASAPWVDDTWQRRIAAALRDAAEAIEQKVIRWAPARGSTRARRCARRSPRCTSPPWPERSYRW